MLNVVVDASVVASALYPKDHRSVAAANRMRASRALYAPALLDFEVLQFIRRYASIDKELTRADIGETIDILFSFPIRRIDTDRALMGRTLDLRDKLTAYDASYVALAERLDATLVTADLKLAKAPGIRCAVEVIS